MTAAQTVQKTSNTMRSDLTMALTEKAANLRYDKISDAARIVAGQCLLDWFGVTTFFLFAVILWIGWAGALTGKPDFAVAWLKREVPDFHYHFNFIAFALATLLTRPPPRRRARML